MTAINAARLFKAGNAPKTPLGDGSLARFLEAGNTPKMPLGDGGVGKLLSINA